MHPTAIVNDPSIIGPEFITLVDLDGRPTTPTARPAAESWPRWTDLVRARPGASDDELERLHLSVGLGDALTRAVWSAEAPSRTDDDFDRAMEQVERDDPTPADWPGSDFAGWNLADLPPIAGGSPEFDIDEPFEPSDEDLACYAEWCRQADQAPSSPVLSLHRLTAIADALYPGQPVAAR